MSCLLSVILYLSTKVRDDSAYYQPHYKTRNITNNAVNTRITVNPGEQFYLLITEGFKC